MSKSVPTILILGAAAVGVLGMLMRQLSDLKSERDRSPYSAGVENLLGGRCVGRVRIVREVSGASAERPVVRPGESADEPFRLVVRATVHDEHANRRQAERVGQFVWLAAMRAGDTPEAVKVVLTGAGDAVSRPFDVARPRASSR